MIVGIWLLATKNKNLINNINLITSCQKLVARSIKNKKNAVWNSRLTECRQINII